MPAEFWQTEQFRQAFVAQHIGWVARTYRTHPHHYAVYGPDGISQTLLGQWLGLSQPQVSRIEIGPPIRNLDTLVYWARVLRIPPRLLWFDMPGSQRRTTANASTMSRGDVQHNPGEESATKRREAIAFTGKALAAALQLAVFETIDRLGIDNYRRQVDNKLITAHQEVSQALAEVYRSADPRSVLTLPAVRDLDDQLRLLSIS
ncbi:MAG: helix-turn-helix domain-containing protein [Pseudonocardiaceae bacterium]